MDPVLESLITTTIREKKVDELVRYLSQLIVEHCQDEIDLALSRCTFTPRSSGSLPGVASNIVERRLLQRRLRLAAKNLATTTKFKRFKTQILSDVAQGFSKQRNSFMKCESRPGTGYDTLFSIKTFTSDDDDDDDTILLTSLNLSQSLKLSNPVEFNQWIAKLTDSKTTNTVKIEYMKKLTSMSSLALYRNSNFSKFLYGNMLPLYENLHIFPVVFPLLSKLANTRDLSAFTMVLRHLQIHSRQIVGSTVILVENKIKFIDYAIQCFRLIPVICNRESRENVKSVIDVFVLFFELPDDFKDGNLLSFALFYACFDPHGAVILDIAHPCSLRRFFGNVWENFASNCMTSLNHLKESSIPGIFAPSTKIYNLWRCFLISTGIITLKHADLSKNFKNSVIENWFLGALKVAVSTGQKPSKTTAFAENALLKASKNRCFCERILKMILSSTEFTVAPTSVYCRVFLNLITHASFGNISSKLLSVVITMAQSLLQNRRRASTSVAVKLIARILQPFSTLDAACAALAVQPYQSVLRQYLQSGNSVFVEIIFKLGISTDKQLWRSFRGHSIIDVAGFDFCQHGVVLTSDDRKIALRTILPYLQGIAQNEETEKVESGLSFTNATNDDIPGIIAAMIIYPGLLLDTFRTFELESFFKEESAKAVERRDGGFFKRFAHLLKNINFLVECRNRLRFPMLVTYMLQKYCRSSQNKLIFDEFCLACLDLLTATTLGAPTELFHATESALATTNGLEQCKDRTKRLTELSHGFYNRFHRPFANERRHLSMAQCLRSKFGSADAATSTGLKAPSVTMLHGLGAVFDYAVYLNKAPTRQSAHRQAVNLRIPVISNETTPDWFIAAVFLASDCHSKLTSTVLRQIEMPICFWPNSFESTHEFIDYLSKSVWPLIIDSFAGNPPSTVKFLDLVNFVHSCGFGIIDFDTIEDYLQLLLINENSDTPEKRVVSRPFSLFWCPLSQ